MNKKQYQSPTMKLVEVKAQQMLCGSNGYTQTNDLKTDEEAYEF